VYASWQRPLTRHAAPSPRQAGGRGGQQTKILARARVYRPYHREERLRGGVKEGGPQGGFLLLWGWRKEARAKRSQKIPQESHEFPGKAAVDRRKDHVAFQALPVTWLGSFAVSLRGAGGG